MVAFAQRAQQFNPVAGPTRLATEMIESAFADMRQKVPLKHPHDEPPRDRELVPGRPPTAMCEHFGSRVRAAAWLVSKGSTQWFEIAQIDQKSALEHSDWTEVAEKLFATIKKSGPDYLTGAGIKPQHIRLIREGIAILTPRAR